MIKKNNEVREFVIDEVANKFIEYVIDESFDIGQIAAEVQESAESKFSEEVDGEAVLQVVRLFYLAKRHLREIDWNRNPFEQLEKCFYDYWIMDDPLQIKQLCSDPIFTKRVKRFLCDNPIYQIKNICEYLQDEGEKDIEITDMMLNEMSEQLEYLDNVFRSPYWPTSKAA